MSIRRRGWPQGIKWTLGVVVAVLVTLAVGWLLFVPIADWLATHDVGHVTGPLRLQAARDAARGRLLTYSAGLFAAGALIFTARNFTLSREGQVTDRYSKAIEQLGSNALDARVGGIYALERVAYDSAKDHPTVMEVLTAFVRQHSGEQWPQAKPGAATPARTTRPDVQAAATAIGRRNARNDRERIRLPRTDLISAYLAGANLARAHLFDADFTHADLPGADFTGADLTLTKLHKATLSDADFRHADLRHAEFIGANLAGVDFTDADLCYAIFNGATVIRLEFPDANRYRSRSHRANLASADFIRAKLYRALVGDANLTGADFTEADFTEAHLELAHLDRANFTRADLTDAYWSQASPAPKGWKRDSSSGQLSRAN